MKIDLSGLTAVVTGGSNGIGLACAKSLAASGASVWIFDLEGEDPAGVAASFGAVGHPADVSESASLERAFQASGPPDIVVANAGVGTFCPMTETTDEEWQRTINVNLTGAFNTIRAAGALMKPRRSGSIVVTASTNSFDGEPMLSAYNASKAGVLGIVRTAAGEFGPFGVRVNAICPGLIRTRLNESAFADEQGIKNYLQQIPLGRAGATGDIPGAVVFLASEAASFITGTTLVIDGGQTATKFGAWSEETAEFHEGRWKLK